MFSITTLDELHDTLMVTRKTFESLYYEAPEESRGQLYYNGVLVRIAEIDDDEIYLQSNNGINLMEEFFGQE
jgi:hypothetical protein